MNPLKRRNSRRNPLGLPPEVNPLLWKCYRDWTLPGKMCRVPAEGEHFPDTNLLDTTLPDPPDYDDNCPLTIDEGTLAANLSTETIERFWSIPPVQASRKGSRQLSVAEKAPRLEIREKYEDLMAEKQRQRQLETNFEQPLLKTRRAWPT